MIVERIASGSKSFPTTPVPKRAYEKVGFIREGTLRETWLLDGRWHDEHVYSMLRREYNARYHPEREIAH